MAYAMPRASLLTPPLQPGAAVAMTPAQQERQNLQVAWLLQAIEAQEERQAVRRIDPASLRLPRPEHDACAH